MGLLEERKSAFSITLNGLFHRNARTLSAHNLYVRTRVRTEFCGHFCISYLLPDCFFSCSASIILQPWRYEKQEAIFFVKWVEAHVHSLTQTQISRTSSDVCHIEGGIKARCL